MLLPYAEATVTARCSTQDALERLRAVVAPPAFMAALTVHPRFQFVGTVDGTAFSVRPNIRGRNAFLPTLEGHVTDVEGGCTLTFRANPNPLLVLGLLLAMGVLLLNGHLAVAGALFVAAGAAFAKSAAFARNRLLLVVADGEQR
jgi:hypothetical protein